MTNRKFTPPKDAEEGHKWQTDDGDPVRIYAHDAGGDYPIHGAIYNKETGVWESSCWTEKGFDFYCDELSDCFHQGSSLVDAPHMVRVQWYVNVYRGGRHVLHRNKEDADDAASPDRIACIKIDMEVPEGRFDE